MKVAPHCRGDSLSSISMDADLPLDTAAGESPKEQPYIPHLISPDHVMAPFPGTPTFGHHRRMSSNGSSVSSPFCASPAMPNFSSLIISVKDIENEHSPDRRLLPRMSPAHRYRSHWPASIDSAKVSRYTIGAMGDVENKPSMVRKLLRRSRLRGRTKSDPQHRGWHRRDSFASLPHLSDIGIAKEDLVDVVRELRQPGPFSCQT
jgi:hypothetical protein